MQLYLNITLKRLGKIIVEMIAIRYTKYFKYFLWPDIYLQDSITLFEHDI